GSSVRCSLGTSNSALYSTTLLVTVGVGSTLRSCPYQRLPRLPRVVKYASMPGLRRDTSAPDTCGCTVIEDRSAISRKAGACWLVFSVCPGRALIETTTPAIDA